MEISHRRPILLSLLALFLIVITSHNARSHSPSLIGLSAAEAGGVAVQATPGSDSPTPTPTLIPPQRTPANMPIVIPAIVIVVILLGAWLVLSVRRKPEA